MVSLVPDAESFGLPDAEERRFNLWLIVGLVILVCEGEPTTVDVWVLLLKLKQRLMSDSKVTQSCVCKP